MGQPIGPRPRRRALAADRAAATSAGCRWLAIAARRALRDAPLEPVMTAAVVAIGTMGLKDAGVTLAGIAARSQTARRSPGRSPQCPRLARRPGSSSKPLGGVALPGSGAAPKHLRVLAKLDPAAAITHLRDRLAHGAIAEQQGCLAVLASMPDQRPVPRTVELARPADRRRRSARDPARRDRGRRPA